MALSDFFNTRTVRRESETLAKMKIQNVKSLPEVLTILQVHRIIESCTTLRMAVYVWTVDSMGLRPEEGLNLQMRDIEAERGLVHFSRAS